VRSYDRQSGRVGCQFQNLEPQDISTLRHLITSHLAGDIVSMGEVLATLQRDNFTKARKVKDGGSGMTPFGRLKAVTFSAGYSPSAWWRSVSSSSRCTACTSSAMRRPVWSAYRE
jgi:alginate biosynthesis protein Alg44